MIKYYWNKLINQIHFCLLGRRREGGGITSICKHINEFCQFHALCEKPLCTSSNTNTSPEIKFTACIYYFTIYFFCNINATTLKKMAFTLAIFVHFCEKNIRITHFWCSRVIYMQPEWYESLSSPDDLQSVRASLKITMSKFANVRQIMLKQRRAAKCPFLQKFIRLALVYDAQNFVSTEELFNEYSRAIAIWTENDSLVGQTSLLMKKRAFFKVRTCFSVHYSASILIREIYIHVYGKRLIEVDTFPDSKINSWKMCKIILMNELDMNVLICGVKKISSKRKVTVKVGHVVQFAVRRLP